MKIHYFWNYYNEYLKYFFARNEQLSPLSYEQQVRLLLADQFTWTAAVTERLKAKGIDVNYTIANAKPLQQRWAAENGISFRESDWFSEIALEQVKKSRPDILWISVSPIYFGEYMQKLRRYCGKIICWLAAPIPSKTSFAGIDCFLTSHQNFVTFFNECGIPAFKLLPSFEPYILTQITKASPRVPIGFVGGLDIYHQERIEVVYEISKKLPVTVWSPSRFIAKSALLRLNLYSTKTLRNYFRRWKLNCQAPVWGLEALKTIANTRMTVNVHIKEAGGFAGNIRIFEAAGAGSLLFTESAENISEILEPGTEVVTYKDIADLIEKLDFYLHHTELCEQLAAAGQQRILQDHNSILRSEQLLKIFQHFYPEA